MSELLVVAGIDTVALTAHNFHYSDRLRFALDSHQADFASDVGAGRFGKGFVVYDEMHFELASQAFEPRAEVRGITNYRIVESFFAAEVSHRHITSGDPEADIQIGKTRVGPAQPVELGEHQKSGVDRRASWVRDRFGSAPESHYAVTHQLVDHSASAQDDISHR